MFDAKYMLLSMFSVGDKNMVLTRQPPKLRYFAFQVAVYRGRI